jgi:YidC/Oxa1 family membrane protein insertase
MEQARMFIAIALSFLVFFLWEMFFVDKEAVRPPVEQTGVETAEPAEPFDQKQELTGPAATPAARDQASTPQLRIGRPMTIETPLFTAVIDDRGAVLTSLKLKKYRETAAADSDHLEMVTKEVQSAGTLVVGMEGNSIPGLNDAVFQPGTRQEVVTVHTGEKVLRYTWRSPQGVVVEKAFTFQAGSYLIPFAVTIKNGSDTAIQDNLYVALKKFSPETDMRYGFEGPSAFIDNGLQQIKVKDIEDKSHYGGKIKWIAVQDRYFMSCLVPENEKKAVMKLALGEERILESRFLVGENTVRPGTQVSYRYETFFGPRSVSLLRSIGNDLDKAVNFGWFDFLAKPCLWLMNFLYGFIPNYGVAIIVLTVIIKVLLWPLGNKSYKSMSEMKKIQPLMTELREKYKDDKKRMNEEVMGLYRTYKINPMGGCLPMLLQIPVFFAFYRMLYEAIELRHAPFFGWITDLSAPDRLFRFGFSIPMMEPPYGIPVLTVVMGATMFLQQKMSPPMGDPTQAKMMMFMPLIFTVIFINFSSGLVLYWLVNNILSISQQYYVQRKYA